MLGAIILCTIFLGSPVLTVVPARKSLNHFLRATRTLPYCYLIRTTLQAWLPAQVISFVLLYTFPGEAGFTFLHTSFKLLLSGLILGPIVETYMMRIIFCVLKRSTAREGLVNALSAVIWGALHFHSESWGLHAIWSFWVMGRCYLSFERISIKRAIVMTAGVHMGSNALSYALTLALSS